MNFKHPNIQTSNRVTFLTLYKDKLYLITVKTVLQVSCFETQSVVLILQNNDMFICYVDATRQMSKPGGEPDEKTCILPDFDIQTLRFL